MGDVIALPTPADAFREALVAGLAPDDVFARASDVLFDEGIIACRDRLANQQSNETLDINQAMQRWLAEFAYRRAVQEY